MILIRKNKFINYKFMRWLLNIIKMNCIKNINTMILKDRENKINELLAFNEPINLTLAIKLILRNLIIREFRDCFIITINESIKYPKTNIKLIDIYRILTYGTLEIKPYNFMHNVLLDIKENIKSYVAKYKAFMFL